MKPKLCIECKHIRGCGRPSCWRDVMEEQDLVTGKMVVTGSYVWCVKDCDKERYPSRSWFSRKPKCGPEGRFFEPKETT